MDKREHLRAYLNASIRSLFASGVVRPTDSIDVIIRAAISQFALDVGTDIKTVLAEIGRNVAAKGVRYVEAAVKQRGANMIEDLATMLLKGINSR